MASENPASADADHALAPKAEFLSVVMFVSAVLFVSAVPASAPPFGCAAVATAEFAEVASSPAPTVTASGFWAGFLSWPASSVFA
eukprot:CAMPEP_0171188462 /NCGR_PEP_ID=MMETSP0790-20130122/17844_1 /TAXON_ID=2925 /ORGANISM="Alexandrium catenella, Strain OF101" /LENGTH=84 /DNA_ID=CAMNT_0011653545 /DNA_START=70 /DNA_END=321 /DNA_ORIENTATION=+